MSKILRNIALALVFAGLLQGVTNAAKMQFFPSNGDLGMYCVYSGEIRIDTESVSVSAIDTRIFATNIVLNSFTGLLSLGIYTHLGTVGNSIMSVPAYPSNSIYLYINWYASDLSNLLNVGDTSFSSYLWSSTGINTTGLLDLYYIPGENFDDSNMQSWIVNGMDDVLSDVNSGYYNFSPRPCVVDTDPLLFTGYASGAFYDPDIITGFYFTIYDYTGNHAVGYNQTNHYRFSSLPADTGNLANYLPVGANDIDNQNGVNSGTITVYLSGISALSSGTLLAPTVLTLTGLDCSQSYDGPGYPLTRNQMARGYKCLVPFSGIYFDMSQVVLVIITGADNVNYLGNTNTGSINFPINIVKSGATIFDIKAYPGSRPGGNFSNIGELRFYNLSGNLVTGSAINTDSFGTGTLTLRVPNGVYYAVYKGQSHLASYLSGVSVVEGSLTSLDFTTGVNLSGTQNKSISEDDGNQYQIAGDLKNILGVYDFTVNGNDIAILTISGFIDNGISVLDPKNLNADGAINVSDISVIGVNFELKDSYFPGNIFAW